MTTVQDLIDRILQPMRDSAQDLFADAELIGYINEATVDLAARERIFHKEDTTCLTSGGGIPFANIGGDSDILEIRWVIDTEGREVTWVDPTTFKEYQEADPDWPVNNPIASSWDETVHLLPAPADGETWTAGYYGLPSQLTSTAETFPLPRVWEAKVVHFGRAQCYYRLGETPLADREVGQYEAGLRPAAKAFDRNLAGMIVLTREAGVFDTDTEAIHQGG